MAGIKISRSLALPRNGDGVLSFRAQRGIYWLALRFLSRKERSFGMGILGKISRSLAPPRNGDDWVSFLGRWRSLEMGLQSE
ncbi:MAG: hypothetical protein ACPL3P_06225 [Anaerolineales bacterium]